MIQPKACLIGMATILLMNTPAINGSGARETRMKFSELENEILELN